MGQDPESALGHAAIRHGLSGILKNLGRSEKHSPQEHAVSLITTAHEGHAHVHKHSKSALGSKLEGIEPRSRKDLEAHLETIRANPDVMLDLGGSIGEELPGHAAQLSAMAARSVNYLDSLRPMPSQAAPLDKVSTVGPMAKQKYDRQLDIAQQPMLAMRHINRGTLQPQDVTTLQTLYPALYKSMAAKLTDRLIDAQSKKKSIPYGQRRALGLFLGQSLDSTMTPSAALAIMKANAGSSKEQTQPQKGGQKKATAAELKETSKAAKLYGTNAQDKELGK